MRTAYIFVDIYKGVSMRLNIDILSDYLGERCLGTRGSGCGCWGGTRNLRGVLPLSAAGEEPDDAILYVASGEELGRGVSAAHLAITGPGAEKVAGHLPNGTTSIVTDYPSEDVLLTVLHEAFEHYRGWDEEMLCAVADRKGLDELVRIASAELASPVALIDSSYSLVTWAGEFRGSYSGTVWEDMLGKGRPSTYWYLNEATDVKLSLMDPTLEPVLVRPVRERGHSHLFAKIPVQGSLFGLLAQVDVNHPFTPGQAALLLQARDRIMQAIVADAASGRHADPLDHCLRLLLSGERVEETTLRFHLGRAGWKVTGGMRVVVVPKPTWISDDESTAFVMQTMQALPTSVALFFDESVVGLIGKDAHLSDKLAKVAALYGTLAIESSPIKTVAELRGAYLQCLEGADLARKRGMDGLVRCADLFGAWLGERVAEDAAAWAWCDARLRDLAASGERGCEQVRCLYEFLLSGGNFARAAKALFLHCNTLRYRIERLGEELGINVAALDADATLRLAVSCATAYQHLI